MHDNASSKKCGKDHILGHTRGKFHFYTKEQTYDHKNIKECGNYKTMNLGYVENDAGLH
jgi:hypothetical protein